MDDLMQTGPTVSTRWRGPLVALVAAVVLATPLLVGSAPEATAFPVADSMETYELCGRVFPDPQAHWPSPSAAPGESPWAKGNAECRAVDFLGWDETLSGLDFLETELFPGFVEVYDLSDPDGRFAAVMDFDRGDGMSAGLPAEDLGRDKSPMVLIRVTDEESTAVPIEEREHFVYALSIHGIERAGVEGGIRAIEDLATWASCERHGDESPANCEQEGEIPHPILETIPDESITAGEALEGSSVWFILSNPDGWRRGDKQDGGFFYQRYNGNGMDLNRDWPSLGYMYRPYTPFSEPESRAVGAALQDVKDSWSGGIDLHGQLVDRAFSFTLIGGQQRPFDKDRRTLQFVKGAWEDAEERLQWSSLIKPNDAPEDDPRMYGVQWGTIWDTIDYTVTGALGDWIDSPLGLDANGIDNEMSMSHLSNCGVGTCWIPEAEQLHVDGNKSLIYAQIHYTFQQTDETFDYEGRAAYLYNPRRLQHEGSPLSTAPERFDHPPQEGFSATIDHVDGMSTHEFEVRGPEDGVFNDGLTATITWDNVGGVGAGSLNEIAIDRRRGEEDPQRGEQEGDEWQTQNSYYNQSPLYLQGGAQIDVNVPSPGVYRLRVQGETPGRFAWDVEFHGEAAWPDPGQLPYDVSNMDFFSMLEEHVPSADKLTRVPIDDVLAGDVDLAAFDTVVAADDAFVPGYSEPVSFRDEAQEAIEGSVAGRAPGAGERNEATSEFFEFEVEPGNAALEIRATWDAPSDYDLYVQRRSGDLWTGDIAAGESGSLSDEFARVRAPRPGAYRVEVHNWAGSSQPINLTVSFYNEDVEPGPGGAEATDQLAEVIDTTETGGTAGPYGPADRDRMAEIARDFVEQGGNLVLTDDSLRAVEWMEVVPPQSVFEQIVFAGYARFSADGGETTTYDDPLAANVDQPGAAEGAGHRHQLSEPVPTGYAIGEGLGAGSMETHPLWGIDRGAWEEAGGRVVGVAGGDVTLGEIAVGDGVVRILGTLLPYPTDEYDHPFGLSSYGVTYSGYEVLRNMLDWENPDGPTPPGDGTPGGEDEADAPLPTTGSGIGGIALVALALAVAAAYRLRGRIRAGMAAVL